MSRRFAVNLWLWYPDASHNNYSALYKAQDAGFDGVEIPTFDGKLDVPVLRDHLSTTRLTPIIIGGGSAYTDISAEDNTVRANGLEYIKRCVDACHALGGTLVCGPLYGSVGATRFLSNEERTKTLLRIAHTLKEATHYAADRGVVIAIEPLCRYDTHLVNTVGQGIELIQHTQCDNIGLLLDTFHMNIEEKSLGNAVKQAGSLLFHLQVCENDRGPPGTGHIDWGELALSLSHIDYKGWISLESFTPYFQGFSEMMHSWRPLVGTQDELAKTSLEFLKEKFSSVKTEI
jgi:D-psicose/D-tagatose/L-ribulose 3-epimerase